MYCEKCGTELTDEIVKCPKCGNEVKKKNQIVSKVKIKLILKN